MKRRSYLFVIAALLCGAWFWAFWGNGPKAGRASFVARGDAGKGAVAVSAGKDTVPTNSGNDPERFIYEGERFGSKQAMEQAKKQDYIDLHGADAKITLHVTDSSGRNVPDAAVKADFGVFEKSTSTTGKTDGNGIFIWNGRTDGEVVYTVEKDGYYKTRTAYRLNLVNGDDVKDGKWIPWGRAIEVTLKEKRNPIPMYAKNIEIVLPQKDETFGFDFKVGDLVTPYGKGEVADIMFTYVLKKPSADEEEYFSRFTIDGIGQGDGVILMQLDIQNLYPLQNEYPSVYEAPTGGYEQRIEMFRRFTMKAELEKRQLTEKDYLVFRSRVTTNDNGEIISANYGKMYFISYGGTPKNRDGGFVKMAYYFNPTPNDRNLEFDTSKNLFGNDSQNRVSIP